jgi:hypothetical protein
MATEVVFRRHFLRRTIDVETRYGGFRPLIVIGTVALWLLSLNRVDLSRMNDFGLISVLPIPVFVALAVLTISFAVSLRERPVRTPLLLLHVLALILMLYGITALVEQVPRFESAWKHVGIAEYVIRNGGVDPTIDAYFNWPGFFILLAFFTKVCGFQSALTFVAWAPVFLELLYLGPLVMIFSRATSDTRLVWLAVWTFYLANWVGQDYLSPQGFNYFLLLVIFAILLTWFGVAGGELHPIFRLLRRVRLPTRLAERLYRWMAPADMPNVASTRGQRTALVAIIIAVFAVVVSSHQLTPFAILGGVTALVVLNRCTLRALPIVMGVMVVLWLRFYATGYLAGHGGQVAEQVGDVSGSVGASMFDRLSGSAGHVFVVYLRTVMAVVLWGLAFVGGLRRLARGHRDFTFAILALVPFPLIALQSYGGEILLRAYLFSLPFMAFFAAAIFFGADHSGRSWFTTAALSVVSIAAIGSFFVTRYGNERMDYFTPQERASVQYLYSVAPPGSLLLGGTVKAPWKYQDYEKYKYRTLADDVAWHSADPSEPDLEAIESVMKDRRYPAAYLFITRSQIANDDMFDLLPVRLRVLKQALLDSPQFKVVYRNDDAVVFVLAK